jgi:DNA-binding HxlR family transcriptional regulator
MSEAIEINPPEAPEASETVEAPAAPEAPASESEVKVHPAYERVLAELPEAWHAKIVPHLQEQDKYFQQQLEKYTPFKEFMDVDISPDVIRDSLRLAEVAISDPVYLYRTLAEQLKEQGLLEEDAIVEEQADAIEEDGEYELDPAIRKEFEARDAKLQEQQDYIESIQFEAEVAEEQAQLEAEIDDLVSRYDISDVQMNRILKILEVQLESDDNASVYTAAKELAEISGIRYAAKGAAPKADAPMVIGGSGGGVPSEPFSIPKGRNEKKSMLAQMFEQQLKSSL